MPKKRKKGNGGGSGLPQGYDKTVNQYQNWNDKFDKSYDASEGYGQNNRWATGAQDWYDNQLSGNMANNPWMSRLFGQTEGLDMGQGMGRLNDYLDGRSGGQGGRSGGRRGGGGGGGYGGSSSNSGGGNIPDSTVGKGFFSEKVNALFDPSRLDPANDPTMQPMVDNIQREADESYWRQVTDLSNQAEGAGRYGGGLYQGMRAAHADEFNEALTGTLAQQYQQARESALQRQMEALGLVNTRDISEGQIAAQRDASSQSAGASAYAADRGYDAQMDGNRLQAIQMMLGAGQFGMQMGGNMSELMQNGQIAANQIGQGWAQIGQKGYDQSANFGQLGLGATGAMGNMYSDAASQRARQQQLAQQQRQWNEGAQSREMNDLIRMMSGLGSMGGEDGMSYMPGSSGARPDGFGWEDLLGSGAAGWSTWLDNQQRNNNRGNR